MHAFFFFGAVKMGLRLALDVGVDPNTKTDIRVRLADPNGQKTNEIAVRLGRPRWSCSNPKSIKLLQVLYV